MVGLIRLVGVHQLGCSMDGAAGGRCAVGRKGAVGTRDGMGGCCPKLEVSVVGGRVAQGGEDTFARSSEEEKQGRQALQRDMIFRRLMVMEEKILGM